MSDHSRPSAADQPVDAKMRAEGRRWLETWKVTAPILEAERFAHLRQLDDATSAREARDLVWPMGTLGEERRGDDAAGLTLIKVLQARLAAR